MVKLQMLKPHINLKVREDESLMLQIAELRDGKISTVIEHSLAKDADFIKAQLIDLLENGKIQDKPNEWDSRDYSRLDKGNRW
jgi:hypothetical protein